jgi:hypothetical protein
MSNSSQKSGGGHNSSKKKHEEEEKEAPPPTPLVKNVDECEEEALIRHVNVSTANKEQQQPVCIRSKIVSIKERRSTRDESPPEAATGANKASNNPTTSHAIAVADKSEKSEGGSLKRAGSKKKVKHSLRSKGGNKAGSISITIMLIAVVIFFFICQFPVLVLNIIQSMFCTRRGSNCALSGLYQYSMVISKFLLICNLSFNFACYCLFNEKFREVFAEKFCLRRKSDSYMPTTSSFKPAS